MGTPFSSFEILAETLVPDGILPTGAPNPFVIQGYFVQISMQDSAAIAEVELEITFHETTGFSQGLGKGAVQAQVIGADGVVSIYKDFFSPPPGSDGAAGFFGQSIGPGETKIFGVQCIPGLVGKPIPELPQNATGWRGYVAIKGGGAGVIATPTHRLLYYTDENQQTALDAAVYPVPTYSGNLQI